MPKKIIAFAGRKGSGKSLMAELLSEKLGAKRFAFADALKELCCKLIGGDVPQLDRWKENDDEYPYQMSLRWINIIHQETGISEDDIIKAIPERFILGVRDLLQVVGTDIIRKYKTDWYVEKTKEKILATPDDVPIIIDDVRFRNEESMIRELGGDIYLIIRPHNLEVSNHISERTMNYHIFDCEHIIVNDSDIDHLKEIVEHYMEFGRFLSKSRIGQLKEMRGDMYETTMLYAIEQSVCSDNPMECIKGITNPFVVEDLKVFFKFNAQL